MSSSAKASARLASRHLPLDLLPADRLAEIIDDIAFESFAAGEVIYEIDAPQRGLYLIEQGAVELLSKEGESLAQLAVGDAFGDRGLRRGGRAFERALTLEPSTLARLDAATFDELIRTVPAFHDLFDRAETAPAQRIDLDGLAATPIRDLMTVEPLTIAPDRSVREAALIMRERDISCLPVVEEGVLAGILTSGDIGDRVVAEGLDGETRIGAVMTGAPLTLSPDSLGFDALLAMTERKISHLPVVDKGRLVGILTSSNLVRRQASSAVFMIADLQQGDDVSALAKTIEEMPRLLVQLVASGVDCHHTTRIITSVTDALTRRLLELAEAMLGAPPVPYLWLACGSQGRYEQTGVSDQDNCLFLDDAYEPKDHGAYFEALARFVVDGLNACGYVYCPGDMMATNPRWRQPVAVWRRYFQGWIDQPDPMAQMLASVMFDLRPIAGSSDLYSGLQAATLAKAQGNSIFRAHMIANSLTHTPPLGLFRGFALIRRGEHKDRLDLKLNGVVPIVDLGRAYALEAAIEPVNTEKRLQLACKAGVLSPSGFKDLIDAYDLIATMRLEHQVEAIRKGQQPDNYLLPTALSDLERSHLRDAFIVVKTLQSALAQRRGFGG